MNDAQRIRGAVLALSALLAGCSGSSPGSSQTPASARVRESTLATSKLPGAAGVGAALRVSDSAAARRAREAEMGAEPP